MSQYAYIPLAQAPNLLEPTTYQVRIPKYISGIAPDQLDSNGRGIPNVLELESDLNGFTTSQVNDIEHLGGSAFANADSYSSYMQTLTNNE